MMSAGSSLLITLLLFLAHPSPAATAETSAIDGTSWTKQAFCGFAVRRGATATEFSWITGELHARGLNALTAELDAGKIHPWFARLRFPWSTDVAARRVLGQKILMLRELDLSSPAARERSLWDVALALFEYQADPGLWSRLAPLTPANWHAERALTNERLLSDMEKLYASFSTWSAPSPMPNLQARYGRRHAVKYYVDHLRRALVVGTAVTTIAAAIQIPGIIESRDSEQNFKKEIADPDKARELFGADFENFKRRVERDRDRLIRDMNAEQAKSLRDERLIADLQEQLQKIFDAYPWLARSSNR